ncbi:site-specific DNA-methyltransferase [Candidatus Woesearchaeota archaeon]|nr:site-specific DNA-methyltransferase [Candidatus Woesearchaeota archaeon]
MKTTHKILYQDARDMNSITSESVDLMVTSPPYPMIEMWDEIFSKQNPEIKKALKEKNEDRAFELMHKELDKVWSEVYRVLKVGGIACINIGDATRSLNGRFQIYPNHARIMNNCLSLGFHALPSVLWVKETNSPNKYMGSGMLPVGAYVTLEHEHILILRKQDKRDFKTKEGKTKRLESAFFWEERNIWFSDKWRDIKGALQKLNNNKLRERSGAYPIELVYRLINMFSIYGDTILDPFLGTGTTTLGAMASGRNSIGIEIDNNFDEFIKKRVNEVMPLIEERNLERLRSHLRFVLQHEKDFKYNSSFYGFEVKTRQEKNIKFYYAKEINPVEDNVFEVLHEETTVNLEEERKLLEEELKIQSN